MSVRTDQLIDLLGEALDELLKETLEAVADSGGELDDDDEALRERCLVALAARADHRARAGLRARSPNRRRSRPGESLPTPPGFRRMDEGPFLPRGGDNLILRSPRGGERRIPAGKWDREVASHGMERRLVELKRSRTAVLDSGDIVALERTWKNLKQGEPS